MTEICRKCKMWTFCRVEKGKLWNSNVCRCSDKVKNTANPTHSISSLNAHEIYAEAYYYYFVKHTHNFSAKSWANVEAFPRHSQRGNETFGILKIHVERENSFHDKIFSLCEWREAEKWWAHGRLNVLKHCQVISSFMVSSLYVFTVNVFRVQHLVRCRLRKSQRTLENLLNFHKFRRKMFKYVENVKRSICRSEGGRRSFKNKQISNFPHSRKLFQTVNRFTHAKLLQIHSDSTTWKNFQLSHDSREFKKKKQNLFRMNE